jgi:flagellar biosynthesis GTPase FlhF
MYRSAIARSGETELVAASAEQRAADAEREIKTRDVHIEAMKADRQKLNTVGRNGNAELAAENARLKREKRELASQVEKLTKEKRDLLEERGVMARAQLAGLTHEEQAETGAILKKINAGTLLTMEENLRLTTLCGGPAARRLLFPQFEKAGESAIRAWAEQTTPSAEASQ